MRTKGRRGVVYRPKATTKPPEYRDRDMERVMRCWNKYWVAGAIWRRKEGIWGCKEAAPIIRWMVGKSPEEAKLELLKRGCEWEWI